MIDLDSLKYAELQKLAKSHGLKANQKAAVLKEQLSKIFAAADGVSSGPNTPAAAELAADSQQENKENKEPLHSSGHRRSSSSSRASPEAAPSDALHRPSVSPAGQRPSRQPTVQAGDAHVVATSDDDTGRADSTERHCSVALSPIVPSASSSPIVPGLLTADAGAAIDSLLDGSIGPAASSCSPTTPSIAAGADVTGDSELGSAAAALAAPRRSSGRQRSSGSYARNSTFFVDDSVSPPRGSAMAAAAAADSLCTGQGHGRASSTASSSMRRRTFDRVGDVDMPRKGSGGRGAGAAQPQGCGLEARDTFGGSPDRKCSWGESCCNADDGALSRRLRSSDGGSSRNSSCLVGAARAAEVPSVQQHGRSTARSLANADAAATVEVVQAAAGQQQLLPAGACDDCALLSSMKQEMSDNEMKASLLAALDRKAEQRQAEIAERVAKVRAAQDSSTKQLTKDRGAAAGKGNTPNFSSIHAKRFAKMESIQSYIARKRQKMEDANRVLGLSSPQLLKSTADQAKSMQCGAPASKEPKSFASMCMATAAAVFTFGSGSKPSSKIAGSASCSSTTLQLPSASSEAPSRTSQEPQHGGARIVKPLRGGVVQVARGSARAHGSSSVVTSKTSAQHTVRPPTASPAPKRSGVVGAWVPSSVAGQGRPGVSLQPKVSAATARLPVPSGAAATSQVTSTISSTLSDRPSVLNTTFTISRSAFDPPPTHAKKPAWQPVSGPAVKPTDAYKKPVLKTRDHRRAEALASGKDKRLGALMQRRLGDD